MTLFHKIVQLRAGATPQTFDGAGSFTFNPSARKLIAIEAAQSMSIYTTDEGFGGALKIQSSNFSGNRYFPFGQLFMAGPATNGSVKGGRSTIIPLDIDIAPSSTMQVDISTIIGATQTGTIDVTFDFIYDDGSTPQDVIDAVRFAPNSLFPVAVKGGQYNYYTAIAATTETALTLNNTAQANIPYEANEIVGCVSGLALDTAVTASEEITGYVRHDLGVTGATDQYTVIGSGLPNLGTEAEGANLYEWSFHPFYLRTQKANIVVNQYVNMYSAITGGADLAIFLLWR